MTEEKIVEEFTQLHKSAARNKTARLRDLYDQIEALRNRGFSHATIIEAMKKHGLEFDIKTFEVTFYRIKREREKNLAQSSAAVPVDFLDRSEKDHTEATRKEIPSSKSTRKMAAPPTQEELKAITRSHMDPNKFIND